MVHPCWVELRPLQCRGTESLSARTVSLHDAVPSCAGRRADGSRSVRANPGVRAQGEAWRETCQGRGLG
eukprot:12793650-Alexandrium_andersonii.AAC.1